MYSKYVYKTNHRKAGRMHWRILAASLIPSVIVVLLFNRRFAIGNTSEPETYLTPENLSLRNLQLPPPSSASLPIGTLGVLCNNSAKLNHGEPVTTDKTSSYSKSTNRTSPAVKIVQEPSRNVIIGTANKLRANNTLSDLTFSLGSAFRDFMLEVRIHNNGYDNSQRVSQEFIIQNRTPRFARSQERVIRLRSNEDSDIPNRLLQGRVTYTSRLKEARMAKERAAQLGKHSQRFRYMIYGRRDNKIQSREDRNIEAGEEKFGTRSFSNIYKTAKKKSISCILKEQRRNSQNELFRAGEKEIPTSSLHRWWTSFARESRHRSSKDRKGYDTLRTSPTKRHMAEYNSAATHTGEKRVTNTPGKDLLKDKKNLVPISKLQTWWRYFADGSHRNYYSRLPKNNTKNELKINKHKYPEMKRTNYIEHDRKNREKSFFVRKKKINNNNPTFPPRSSGLSSLSPLAWRKSLNKKVSSKASSLSHQNIEQLKKIETIITKGKSLTAHKNEMDSRTVITHEKPPQKAIQSKRILIGGNFLSGLKMRKKLKQEQQNQDENHSGKHGNILLPGSQQGIRLIGSVLFHPSKSVRKEPGKQKLIGNVDMEMKKRISKHHPMGTTAQMLSKRHKFFIEQTDNHDLSKKEEYLSEEQQRELIRLEELCSDIQDTKRRLFGNVNMTLKELFYILNYKSKSLISALNFEQEGKPKTFPTEGPNINEIIKSNAHPTHTEKLSDVRRTRRAISSSIEKTNNTVTRMRLEPRVENQSSVTKQLSEFNLQNNNSTTETNHLIGGKEMEIRKRNKREVSDRAHIKEKPKLIGSIIPSRMKPFSKEIPGTRRKLLTPDNTNISFNIPNTRDVNSNENTRRTLIGSASFKPRFRERKQKNQQQTRRNFFLDKQTIYSDNGFNKKPYIKPHIASDSTYSGENEEREIKIIKDHGIQNSKLLSKEDISDFYNIKRNEILQESTLLKMNALLQDAREKENYLRLSKSNTKSSSNLESTLLTKSEKWTSHELEYQNSTPKPQFRKRLSTSSTFNQRYNKKLIGTNYRNSVLEKNDDEQQSLTQKNSNRFNIHITSKEDKKVLPELDFNTGGNKSALDMMDGNYVNYDAKNDFQYNFDAYKNSRETDNFHLSSAQAFSKLQRGKKQRVIGRFIRVNVFRKLNHETASNRPEEVQQVNNSTVFSSSNGLVGKEMTYRGTDDEQNTELRIGMSSRNNLPLKRYRGNQPFRKRTNTASSERYYDQNEDYTEIYDDVKDNNFRPNSLNYFKELLKGAAKGGGAGMNSPDKNQPRIFSGKTSSKESLDATHYSSKEKDALKLKPSIKNSRTNSFHDNLYRGTKRASNEDISARTNRQRNVLHQGNYNVGKQSYNTRRVSGTRVNARNNNYISQPGAPYFDLNGDVSGRKLQKTSSSREISESSEGDIVERMQSERRSPVSGKMDIDLVKSIFRKVSGRNRSPAAETRDKNGQNSRFLNGRHLEDNKKRQDYNNSYMSDEQIPGAISKSIKKQKLIGSFYP